MGNNKNKEHIKKVDIRHEARKIALCILFAQIYQKNKNFKEFIPDIKELLEIDSYDKDLTSFLVSGVSDNLEVIDDIIEYCAPEWPLSQVSRVDLSVLRLAVFELTIAQNAPPKVVINEAVEIAKTFANDSSGKFVNGVLATVLTNYR